MAGLTAASTLLSGCGASGSAGGSTSAANSGSSDAGELYVYNWGEYIDEDVISQFEDETGIKVIYDMFETNEEMYPVIEAGGVNYDVVCPSDYMIQKTCLLRSTSTMCRISTRLTRLTWKCPSPLTRRTNTPFLTAGEP